MKLDGAKEVAKKIFTKENAKIVGGWIKKLVVTSLAVTISNREGLPVYPSFTSREDDIFDFSSLLYTESAKDKAILSLYNMAKNSWGDTEKVNAAKEIAKKAIESGNDNTRKNAIRLLERLTNNMWSYSCRNDIVKLISEIGDAE